ncbi:hypothetical protein BaRGS_00025968 [Batillaria attramentaria]|uniref:Uncharacterized protein n=1 Tax=Batillaria attramentaria TaxID=370345 RepID=A0ABD0K6R7_9CAEN
MRDVVLELQVLPHHTGQLQIRGRPSGTKGKGGVGPAEGDQGQVHDLLHPPPLRAWGAGVAHLTQLHAVHPPGLVHQYQGVDVGRLAATHHPQFNPVNIRADVLRPDSSLDKGQHVLEDLLLVRHLQRRFLGVVPGARQGATPKKVADGV